MQTPQKTYRPPFQKTLFGLIFLLLVLFPALSSPALAQVPAPAPDSIQTDAATINKARLRILGIGFGVAYTGLLINLHNSWYKGMPRSDFHFFNDNFEWKQVDKAGHFYGAFQQSRVGIQALRWAGVPEKKAILYGSLTGIIMQTPIEVFDGYQSNYGASAGDLVANTAGSAAVLAQELTWGETRLMPKFSFRTTEYAKVRPNVLGKSLAERALKDYNGQTYWLAVDVAKFLPAESKYPKWLNLAVGYGAQQIVYNDPDLSRMMGFDPYRQYYLTLDLNLMGIKTESKFLKTTFYLLSIFHFPAPALEYNRKHGLEFHPVYF